MKIRGNEKLYWLAVPPLALAASIGSIAGANWLHDATGTAPVTSQALVPDSVGGNGSGLYPGATVPVTVTIHNANAYSEHLLSITTGAITDGSVASTDIAVPSATYTTVVIPAGQSVTETLQATMVAAPAGNPSDTYNVALTASLGAGS